VTGKPIAGLYACGHTAADLVFGGGYNSGTAIGGAITFGYLASQDVANSGASTAAAADAAYPQRA
jgi:succinate dehydrogenase/fumarate reductase flavoprotein subunit